ncbi:MAG TPA: hypothetical protein VI318_03180 [Baekduia sp.]
MTAETCLICGAVHGSEQRYCLTCGAPVGRRSIDLDEAIALQHDGPPTTGPAPAPVPPAPGGVWRRPMASVVTAAALAVGVAAGFLLDPAGGEAGRQPVVLGSLAAAPVAPSAAAPPTTAAPATTTAPPAVDPGTATVPTTTTASKKTTAPAAPATPVVKTPVAAPVAAPKITNKTTTTGSTKAKAKSGGSAKASKPAVQTEAAADGLPAIDHVWVIGIGTPLPEQDDSYLGGTLLPRGTELSHYTPAATDPLAGAAALIAGQAPSADAPTLAGQLADAKESWRAYAAGAAGCDGAPGADPFLAFPTVTSAAGCADAIADLSRLPDDLKAEDKTPSFSYIAADPTLAPDALDAFLKQVVPPIRASEAYKKSGLLAIVPTSANPIAPTGALLLSPFAAAATSDDETLGPYTLLRTFEDLLGLDHLGHAADADVKPLSSDVLVPND